MAWTRECGHSLWRLTANSDVARAGYYYWAAEGTPHFPQPHLLGSNVWLDKTEIEPGALGEVEGAWRRTDGTPPAVIPAPRTIGDPSCLANGERAGLPLVPFTPNTPGLTLPRNCYVKADIEYDANVYDCRFHWYAGEIIRRAYTDTDDARDFALEYFGLGSTATVIPESDWQFFPQAVVIMRGTEAYLFITGTQQTIQWIAQALIAPEGLFSGGSYSAGRIWEFAARRMIELTVAFTGDGVTRWVICGHSYGGAVAQLVAAKILIGNADSRVDILTYGSPKPGDQRLQDILAGCRQTHLCNENDPVPYLPPNVYPQWVNEFLTDVLKSYWQSFRRPRHITFIPRDGSPPQRIVQDRFSTSTLGVIAVGLMAGITPSPAFPHVMAAYVAAIRRYCVHLLPPYPAGAEWPQFNLCDPILKWPESLEVEISFGELATARLTLRHYFTSPTFALWVTDGPPVTLIDLFGGDASGKIVINGLLTGYVCGDAFMGVNVDLAAPFAYATVYDTPYVTQNPFRVDLELMEGGDPGPVATLASFAGDVSRPLTARISGPFLG